MRHKSNQTREGFREIIGTMDAEGTRRWVYPRRVSGVFFRYRTYVSWVLLAVLLAGPWIKINGTPLFLFNFLERRFSIFGKLFYPQDFIVFSVATIVMLVFIILFTVVYGRIFCGWICPQTIFLEMVFRKIEYAIDGDRGAQIRLSQMPWNGEKIRKRLLKSALFLLISILVSHTFLAYIIGGDQLILLFNDGPLAHLDTFIAVLVFTGLFYFVFAWFREQACTLVCPYGRLQGVLIDKDTINVAYDFVRGEGATGRAKFRKNEDRTTLGKGDCIDCNQCVEVCPTGIDIRNGIQLECVNCTACIDACDSVMEKVGLPKGLIRYASENEIAKGIKPKWTIKRVAYTAILLLLVCVFSAMLAMRSDVQSQFLRKRGMNFIRQENKIVNLYEYALINKTNKDQSLSIRIISHPKAKLDVSKVTLAPGAIKKGNISVTIDEKMLKNEKEKIQFGLYNQEGKLIDAFTANFSGPIKL